MNPLVSVVIPTFNRRNYLQEAVDSVLQQTYTNYEILVIDDGSTDGTPEVLKARYGSRIRYFWQENQGESVARNKGIELAKGGFIAFLDSDDLWLPNKLAKQVAFLNQHPEYCGVFCQAHLIDEEGRPLPGLVGHALKKEDLMLNNLLFRNSIAAGGSTVMISRKFLVELGGFDPAIKYGEDWDLWIRVVQLAQLGFVAEPLIRLRIHSQAQTAFPSYQKAITVLHDHVYTISKVRATSTNPQIGELTALALANEYLHASLVFLATGHETLAGETLKVAGALSSQILSDRTYFQNVVVHYSEGFETDQAAFAFVQRAVERWKNLPLQSRFDDRIILRRVRALRLISRIRELPPILLFLSLFQAIIFDPGLLNEKLIYYKLLVFCVGEMASSSLRQRVSEFRHCIM